jgi:SP family general alpha glucoside:H+ symporter-like MFS transporter
MRRWCSRFADFWQGRSYYEIDIMFERKIPARQFKSYVVDMDADEQMRREQGIARS